MPDRYGETDPVVDLDSRRQAREAQAKAETARAQQRRHAETRATHAPLDSRQADQLRAHRSAVTAQAEARRDRIRIANCPLCDDDGYRGACPCDHKDHRPAARRGMDKIRAAMGWTDRKDHP